mmetsp:Transcript_50523/g.145640  ORF Transcript_50523/g.145640 Transcript_50523/m.145640 type:complete len:247 (+) Transcript_50523:213-953(+)
MRPGDVARQGPAAGEGRPASVALVGERCLLRLRLPPDPALERGELRLDLLGALALGGCPLRCGRRSRGLGLGPGRHALGSGASRRGPHPREGERAFRPGTDGRALRPRSSGGALRPRSSSDGHALRFTRSGGSVLGPGGGGLRGGRRPRLLLEATEEVPSQALPLDRDVLVVLLGRRLGSSRLSGSRGRPASRHPEASEGVPLSGFPGLEQVLELHADEVALVRLRDVLQEEGAAAGQVAADGTPP